MGQAKDRRLTRLRLPVSEFDSIEGGPRIPPRGASHESLMQARNRSKRVGRNIKMACRLTTSEVAIWLRKLGRQHIIGFCKGSEKVMQSTQSSCDETLGLIRNGSSGNEDSSRRFQTEVESALAAEAQG